MSRVLPVIQDLRQYIGKVRRELVLEASDILKLTTPILTGHAVSNWIARLGHPFIGVVGSREHVDYGPQQQGIQELIDEPLNSRRVANLTNSVHYVPHLNQGSSRKAVSGFIETAVAQAKVNVRLRLGRLRRAR